MNKEASHEARTVIQAYRSGIFPMAETQHDEEWVWVDPEVRGIIPLDGLRISRSLRRRLRTRTFEISVDTDFTSVIGACAESVPGREETWINEPLRQVFLELHSLGHAHCVECRKNEILVGGLYGLVQGGVFFGESMFSRETDASKVALVHLVERLRIGGFALLDTQFVNPHLNTMGGCAVDRDLFHVLLDTALAVEADFFRAGPAGSLTEDAYSSFRT